MCGYGSDLRFVSGTLLVMFITTLLLVIVNSSSDISLLMVYYTDVYEYVYIHVSACITCAIIPIASPYISICVMIQPAVRLLYSRDDCWVASCHGI
jgi:hypothetical protein